MTLYKKYDAIHQVDCIREKDAEVMKCDIWDTDYILFNGKIPDMPEIKPIDTLYNVTELVMANPSYSYSGIGDPSVYHATYDKKTGCSVLWDEKTDLKTIVCALILGQGKKKLGCHGCDPVESQEDDLKRELNVGDKF